MTTLTTHPATAAVAKDAFMGIDGSFVIIKPAPGMGPKDHLDALEMRTGSREWDCVRIRDGYFTYAR